MKCQFHALPESRKCHLPTVRRQLDVTKTRRGKKHCLICGLDGYIVCPWDTMHMTERLTPLNALLTYGKGSDEYQQACMAYQDESERRFREGLPMSYEEAMDIVYPNRYEDAMQETEGFPCPHCSCYDNGDQCCGCGNISESVDNL